eukprot:3134958-Rhodomonas_salina.4
MDTVDGFLTHFLRKEYGTFRLYSGNENSQMGDQLWQALYLYVQNLTFESTLYVGAGLNSLSSPICFVSSSSSSFLFFLVAMLTCFRRAVAALVVLGVLRSVVGALSNSTGASVGVAFLTSFTFYMIVFHMLSNLPLDQVPRSLFPSYAPGYGQR